MASNFRSGSAGDDPPGSMALQRPLRSSNDSSQLTRGISGYRSDAKGQKISLHRICLRVHFLGEEAGCVR